MMRYTISTLFLLGCPGQVGDKTPIVGGDSGAEETGSRDTDTGACDAQTWYADVDSDGFGDPAVQVSSCDRPDGFVANAGDCDDTNADRYPEAQEICGDGLVNDCDDTDGSAAAASCPSSGPYQLTAADAKLLGEGEDSFAGWAVAGAGDVNGDGYADLLVGARWVAGEFGTAYRVLGPVTGHISLGDAATKLLTPDSGVWAVANAGDQDGDGLPEMLVGTPGGGSDLEGTALLVPASAMGELSPADVSATLIGESRYDWAGYSVSGLGDADGDGWDDLLVSAPFATGSESTTGHCADEDAEEYGDESGQAAGAVYLLQGPVFGTIDLSMATAKLLGEDGNDIAGYLLAHPGDMNGDGLADLLMSAPGQCESGLHAGAAYVVYGPVSGDLSLRDADMKVTGEDGYLAAGTALSGAGDVDGDGYADMLVGASDRIERGITYLVLGPGGGVVSLSDADATLAGEGRDDQSGYSVGSIGDLDLDGHDDLIIGAIGVEADETGNVGASYLVYGPIGGEGLLRDADVKLMGAGGLGCVGYSVDGAGDVDADGRPDVVLGDPCDSEAGDDAGAAYLVLSSGPIIDGGYGP